MKTLLAFTLLLLSSWSSKAQQYYFAYLQTENKQPFYVKVNDKLFSSTTNGYVVIPKLQSGEYLFSIGFPKAEWPQQNLKVNIKDQDEGYLLKDFSEKGWGLFNMQSLALTMPENGSAVAQASVAKNDDGFSSVLAGVVNSPGLNDKPVVAVTPKPAPVKEEKIAEEKLPVVVTEGKTAKTNSTKKDSEVKKPESINRISSASDAEGTILVYVDQSSLPADTIRIFLPAAEAAKQTAKAEEPLQPLVGAESKSDAENVAVPVSKETTASTNEVPAAGNPQPGEPKFIGIELPNPNATASPIAATKPNETIVDTARVIIEVPVTSSPQQATPETSPPVVKAVQIFNSDCKSVATEDDFMKLRKKMVGGNDNEEMISIAKKAYKSKCYTTEQIKNLGVLFLNDEGKYQFFDASYPYVYDSSNYPSLQDQLYDSYFINRFKAMVTH